MSTYEQNALDTLAQVGGKIKIRLANEKPSPWSGWLTPHYRVTLSGPGGKYTLDYFASVNDGKNDIPATAYDVLACLEWFTPDSFAEFCAEFGYDEDSRKAEKIWRACLRQSKALHRIFPSQEARDQLADIR